MKYSLLAPEKALETWCNMFTERRALQTGVPQILADTLAGLAGSLALREQGDFAKQ